MNSTTGSAFVTPAICGSTIIPGNRMNWVCCDIEPVWASDREAR